jgi:hypothetical protein
MLFTEVTPGIDLFALRLNSLNFVYFQIIVKGKKCAMKLDFARTGDPDYLELQFLTLTAKPGAKLGPTAIFSRLWM